MNAIPLPSEMESRASFGAKIARLIGKAKYVQKTGKNAFHNYKYATEADFLALVKPLLDEEKLAIVADTRAVVRFEVEPTKQGKKQWVTQVEMQFKLIDGETGHAETLTSFGTGIDSEDKGLYKAVTGCVKYFIAKLFLIETGDDPEVENDNEKEKKERQPASQGPLPKLEELPVFMAGPTPAEAYKEGYEEGKKPPGAGPTIGEMAIELQQLMELSCFTSADKDYCSTFLQAKPSYEALTKKLRQVKKVSELMKNEEAKKSKAKPRNVVIPPEDPEHRVY